MRTVTVCGREVPLQKASEEKQKRIKKEAQLDGKPPVIHPVK